MTGSLPRHFLAPVAGFLIFALVGLLVLEGYSENLDRILFLHFAGWARSYPAVMAILHLASWTADTAVRTMVGGMLVIGLLLFRRWRTALFAFVAMAGGAWFCSSIKQMVMRLRPDLLPQYQHLESYSFPSGHAWNGAIFYGVIALVMAQVFAERGLRRAIATIAVFMVLLVGMARIALGVHWPSDVMAGWIGGASWLLLCRALLLTHYDGKRTVKGL